MLRYCFLGINTFLKKSKYVIRKLLFEPYVLLRFLLFQYRYYWIKKRLKNKKRINVVFFIIHASVWKLDGLYKKMCKNKRLNPIIVICPYISQGEANMFDEMCEVEKMLTNKNYHFVNAYDRHRKVWLDVKTELCPDIVFFTNPYFGITKKEYYITNYTNSLNCYVPYSYTCDWLYEFQYNQPLQNFVWRFFLESNISKKIAKKHSLVRAKNVLVTGYPGLDIFFDKDYQPINVWKNTQQIKLIWAPHHTIGNLAEEAITFSTFLQYSDYMLEVAKKYKNILQIAFKPHPILKPKLYKHALWGKERTDAYYHCWETMENTQLEMSDYIDLFMTSDAMIFDSVSFITEYLYTKKPALFLCREGIEKQLNEMGKISWNIHYKANSKEDIDFFINLLLEGKDPLREGRVAFYKEYLMPINRQTATDNIYSAIEKLYI